MLPASVKSFPTLADAEAFLAGQDPSQDPNSSSYGTHKFYAVRNGRVPGLYLDWPSAQEQITGWTKPKHRCFTNRAEAEAYLSASEVGRVDDGHDFEQIPQTEPANVKAIAPAMTASKNRPPEKKAKKSHTSTMDRSMAGPSQASVPLPYQSNETLGYAPGEGPLPPGSVDGFDPDIFLNPITGKVEYKSQAQKERKIMVPKPAGVLRIYTDGSSLGNGQYGAVSGVGVYFGAGDDR